MRAIRGKSSPLPYSKALESINNGSFIFRHVKIVCVDGQRVKADTILLYVIDNELLGIVGGRSPSKEFL